MLLELNKSQLYDLLHEGVATGISFPLSDKILTKIRVTSLLRPVPDNITGKARDRYIRNIMQDTIEITKADVIDLLRGEMVYISDEDGLNYINICVDLTPEDEF